MAKNVIIPYFYEEHIENEKREIKRQLIQEIAGELEENKKYAIKIKTAIEDECCVGGYRITASIELTEVPQIEVEFVPQREILQPVHKAKKSILQKIKDYFKGGQLMIHALKTEPAYFEASAAGIKSFEVRKNDRTYSPGDYVALNEWNGEGYTGRCTLHKIVYILSDTEYCKEGYVVLGLEPCVIRTRGEMREPIPCNRGVPVYERN